MAALAERIDIMIEMRGYPPSGQQTLQEYHAVHNYRFPGTVLSVNAQDAPALPLGKLQPAIPDILNILYFHRCQTNHMVHYNVPPLLFLLLYVRIPVKSILILFLLIILTQ